MTKSDDDIVLTIAPSGGRRWVGVSALVLLGCVLLYVAVFGVAPTLARALYVIFAILVLRGALAMYRATSDSIVLTQSELRTGSGRVLTPVANVTRVDRSPFAFKPSNGFLVHLREPTGRGWAPGLFWQRGRLLGIGGVLPAGQSRAMADLLSGMLKPTS